LLPSCSADRRACVSNSKLPARTSIKVAVGYCTARCYQQFDYCIYRGEPLGRSPYSLPSRARARRAPIPASCDADRPARAAWAVQRLLAARW
jgi:hypothetical protein